jgi:hypothetical protein
LGNLGELIYIDLDERDVSELLVELGIVGGDRLAGTMAKRGEKREVNTYCPGSFLINTNTTAHCQCSMINLQCAVRSPLSKRLG